jgi:hypothetical protein
MNRQKWILAAVVVLSISFTGGLLARLKVNQKPGLPGVKTAPLPDSKNLEVLLPEQVLDYSSQVLTQQALVMAFLPKDTSFGQRIYTAPDGFGIQMNVVLMGSDRTSMHKPQFCLEGAGWKIDSGPAGRELIHIDRPVKYDLPVIKLLLTNTREAQGQAQPMRGVFLYWFVADNALSADSLGYERLWSSARQLVQHGEPQRWAYILCFSTCPPGQEAATLERLKKFIAASVPEFQLYPRPEKTASVHQQ